MIFEAKNHDFLLYLALKSLKIYGNGNKRKSIGYNERNRCAC